MGTSIPKVYTGIPTMTPGTGEIFKEWYITNLNNMDNANDMDDSFYYLGASDYMGSVLDLLYSTGNEAVKKSKGNFKRAVFITAAVTVGYIYLKNKTEINAIFGYTKDAAVEFGSDVKTEFNALQKKTNNSEDKIAPAGYKRVQLDD